MRGREGKRKEGEGESHSVSSYLELGDGCVENGHPIGTVLCEGRGGEGRGGEGRKGKEGITSEADESQHVSFCLTTGDEN